MLKSPFRFVVQPIIDHVLEIERNNPSARSAALPELVERHWYQYFLHNQRAQILASSSLTQGMASNRNRQRAFWYLRKQR